MQLPRRPFHLPFVQVSFHWSVDVAHPTTTVSWSSFFIHILFGWSGSGHPSAVINEINMWFIFRSVHGVKINGHFTHSDNILNQEVIKLIGQFSKQAIAYYFLSFSQTTLQHPISWLYRGIIGRSWSKQDNTSWTPAVIAFEITQLLRNAWKICRAIFAVKWNFIHLHQSQPQGPRKIKALDLSLAQGCAQLWSVIDVSFYFGSGRFETQLSQIAIPGSMECSGSYGDALRWI